MMPGTQIIILRPGTGNQEKIETQSIKTTTDAIKDEKTEDTRPKHPLEHTWTMWLYRNITKNWEQNLAGLTSFGTVEDFWCLYHHIKLPSEIGDGQYSVFKDGMRPAWEDAGNKHGGRWLLTLEKRHALEVDQIWTDMILLMIGENFGEANSSICGAVVNAKAANNKSKLAIWVSNKNNEKHILEIGIKFKKVLKLPFKITFHAHNMSKVTMYTV